MVAFIKKLQISAKNGKFQFIFEQVVSVHPHLTLNKPFSTIMNTK